MEQHTSIPDKYRALWVSNSSMNDFFSCPRLYYLRNIYKDPKTRRKITIINPSLSLGQAVHEVLESLALLPAAARMRQPLLEEFEKIWVKYTGRKGGFSSMPQEKEYKDRGENMIARVIKDPGPLNEKAIRLKNGKNNMPPNYYLSPEENIILCGRIDWINYIAEHDSVHIIDFKTGNNEEKADSLQLPIYCLLVKNCQKRIIEKISYWYLAQENGRHTLPVPDMIQAEQIVLEKAKKIKQARLAQQFLCPRNGCFACLPFENIINNNAELVGNSDYQDIYAV